MADLKNEVIKECNELKKFWSPRDKKFKEWYKIIQLDEGNKQENLENFINPDPQSTFKLMRHLLDQPIPHKLPASEVTMELMEQAAELELLYDTAWSRIFEMYRRRGRQGWLWDLIGLVLSTGWYSVMSYINPQTGQTCEAEILNPVTVYPIWADRLIKVARIVPISEMDAKILAYRNGFKLKTQIKSTVNLYDYWRLDEQCNCYNTIIIGSDLVKSENQEPFTDIPIFISPLGGLPDTGLITGDSNKWKGEIGQSLVATAETTYKTVDRWWSYMMQILRDTAQFRIIERSRSGQAIVKPEDVFKRGAIFRMTPEESVEAFVPPAIPIELRSTQLDLEAMQQRATGVSFESLSNFTNQKATSYAMSRMAAATAQAAKPFHEGIINCLTDIDNSWLQQMQTYGYKPYGKKLPSKLPDDIRMSAKYEIKIPGDLIQRATTARMLDPDFRLPYAETVEALFPEYRNANQLKAKVRADVAESNPINAAIALVQYFRQQSALLSAGGDDEGARLFSKAADRVEASLGVEEAQPTMIPSNGQQPIGNRTEALPPGQTTTTPTEMI